MADYSRAEAAEHAGLTPDAFDRLVELGLLTSHPDGRFSVGDARKASFFDTLLGAGVPDVVLADEFRKGTWSIDFLASPSFAHFSLLGRQTFDELAESTGVPLALLMVIREAIGSAVPDPEDRVREIELAVVPYLRAQLDLGYTPETVARTLRTMGETLRRLVLTEEQAFATHVIEPVARRPGASGADISGAAEAARARLAEDADRAALAVLHAQQAQVWTSRMLETFEGFMARAGLLGRAGFPPAICFLDITGYTRLTEERGDEAAAELADRLRPIVQRVALRHGGRAVKWLGDGVMLHFRDPGRGVMAALDMVDAVAEVGLPPAHVGLHAGQVLLQDGDYFGQTVNVAARIAAYARPGEVVVSATVVEAAEGDLVTFATVGAVELKGVSGLVELSIARRP